MPQQNVQRGSASIQGVSTSFDEDVTRVVLQLRSALAGVFSALGRPIRGGTDLQRELGLPGTLSWQLHGLISTPDPVTAATQVPGRQASKRALAAAAAKGVPQALLDRAARAFDDFEACVERHTGSRAAFASMISGLVDSNSAGADLKARRDAFRANSHIYGVQVATRFNTFIFHPGSKPGWNDFLFVHGLVGIQVMRAFDKLFVSRHRSEPDNPRADYVPTTPQPVLEPLEDPGGAGPIPVLAEYSSAPLPRFSSEANVGAFREISISGPPVGRTGALSFFLAERWPETVPRDEALHNDGTILHPTELAIQDVLVADELAGEYGPPTMGVFGGALHEVRRRYREVDRINVHAQVGFAGRGVESLQTPAAPKYADMLARLGERLGWDAGSFHTYRCVIEYPVLHSLVNVTLPVRQPPGR
jgi:hypothetical protein